MTRSSYALLAIASSIVAMLAMSGTATAAERMQFAVMNDSTMIGRPWHTDEQLAAGRERTLERAKQLGATHVRIMVYWHYLHTRNKDHARYLKMYKDSVMATHAKGLRVQLTLTAAADPGWGCPDLCLKESGGDQYLSSPGIGADGMRLHRALGVNPRRAAFAGFVSNSINEFYPLGVRRFSIGNEPNIGNFLCQRDMEWIAPIADKKGHWKCPNTHRSARLYRRIYIAAYRQAVRTLGPNRSKVQLLIGELSSGGEGSSTTNARVFMRKMTKPGKPLFADGFALHPYQFVTSPKTDCSKVKSPRRGLGISCLGVAKSYLKDLAKSGRLRRAGGGTKPVGLYLTEFGISNQGAIKQPETIRAQWTRDAFEVARKHGAQQMLVYHLFNVPGVSWNTPVLDENNVPYKSFHYLRDWAMQQDYNVADLP